MPAKIYRIKLTRKERAELEEIRLAKARGSARRIQRAYTLLLCDEGVDGPGWIDEDVATATGQSTRSVQNLRRRCCEVGPLGALERKPRETPPNEPKITGDVEARIITLACSDPPEGQSRWTLRLLADRVVKLEILESISRETVRQVLKKTNLSLGSRSAGASRRNRMQSS